MKKILTAAFLLTLAAAPLSAQTKAETKLYNKTLSKPTVAAFDKFLKKYPSSVYAADILARKDTLLNISPYSEAQAAAIAAELLPGGVKMLAIAGLRRRCRRHGGAGFRGCAPDLCHPRDAVSALQLPAALGGRRPADLRRRRLRAADRRVRLRLLPRQGHPPRRRRLPHLRPLRRSHAQRPRPALDAPAAQGRQRQSPAGSRPGESLADRRRHRMVAGAEPGCADRRHAPQVQHPAEGELPRGGILQATAATP